MGSPVRSTSTGLALAPIHSQRGGGLVPGAAVRLGYLARQTEIDAAVARVLKSGSYVLGAEVEALEREFAAYLGVAECVGVGTGTDAVALSLRALGVGPADLVYTVSHTAVATVAAIELTGAMPVFVDVDETSYTMDPVALASAVDATWHVGRPAAVVPVHLYGNPAAMVALLEVARRYGLAVVEDCAQAHGAAIGSRRVGCFGGASAFSFYPTKNLGGLGDGGMVATDDRSIAEQVRLLRQYGWIDRPVSERPGTNSRLDELQAAIVRARLRHLDEDNDRRRCLADRYRRGLQGSGVTLPTEVASAHHVYHQFVVRAPRRDGLRRHLAAIGVATAVHYPVAVHLQPAYLTRLHGGPLVHTETAASEVLSLPIHPYLQESEVDTVVEAVREWVGQDATGDA